MLAPARLPCKQAIPEDALLRIMPGAIPHIIREVSSQLPLPVLCAGLVKTEAEIHEVLKAGAQAVATSRRPLWFASSLREVAA